jgi:hypothetical protein
LAEDDHDHEHDHHHPDLAPYFDSGNGELLIGSLTHGTTEHPSGIATPPPVRAFGWGFGDDYLVTGNPYTSNNPGVNQNPGTGDLPDDGIVRFDIVSDLLYWNGAGEVDFGPIVGDTYITTGLTGEARVDGSGPPTGGPFGVQVVHDGGRVHKHFQSTIGTDSGANPAEGIYAYQMTLQLDNQSNGGGVYTSEPVWIVMKTMNAEGHALHEAVDVLGVPEPGSIVLLLSGLLAVGVGTRRRRG